MIAQDFIHPPGQLQETFFPDDDIVVLVDTWLSQATDNTAAITEDGVKNMAVTAYVYWRGYQTVADRLAVTPNRETSFNDRTTEWQDDRIAHFQEMAEGWKSAYDEIIDDEAGGKIVTNEMPVSGHMRNVVTW